MMTSCAPLLARFQPDGGRRRVSTIALPEIQEIWSPNFSSRSDAEVTTIVLHHTAGAGDAVAVARYFQTVESQVSSHYIVDRDGSIVRCVPDAQKAWHAGVSSYCDIPAVNAYSIGIEICNRGDNVEPYPPAQMAGVIRLVAYLADTYRIPLTRITRHRDIALPPGRKVDPSDNFAFSEVIIGARRLLDARPLPSRR
jgi:N-acetylmuramoyl-L-alanine amidase